MREQKIIRCELMTNFGFFLSCGRQNFARKIISVQIRPILQETYKKPEKRNTPKQGIISAKNVTHQPGFEPPINNCAMVEIW